MKYGLLSFLLMIVAVIALTIFSYNWSGWAGVGAVGSVASILGLTLTLKIAWDVDQLRDIYRSKVKLGEHFRQFEDALSLFNKALSEEEKQELRNLAGKIQAIFREITLHLHKRHDIEFPEQQIGELIKCKDGRSVLSKSKDLAPRLMGVQVSLESEIYKKRAETR